MRYQTEIHVSSDRYVCLQLPSYFPEGKATVVVTVVVVWANACVDQTQSPMASTAIPIFLMFVFISI